MTTTQALRQPPSAPAGLHSTDSHSGAPDGHGGLGTRPTGVRLRARRSPLIAALGILLACLGGLGGALLFQAAAERTSVLVMAHSVARGEIVQADDVSVTTLGRAPGVAHLDAGEVDTLVGRRAVVDLPAGSLPGPGSVGEAVVPPGAARVGLRLDLGRAPSSGLAPGTKISIVNTTAGGPSPLEGVVAAAPARTAAGDAWVVDVAVAPADAATLARWAAAEQVSLVRLGDS